MKHAALPQSLPRDASRGASHGDILHCDTLAKDMRRDIERFIEALPRIEHVRVRYERGFRGKTKAIPEWQIRGEWRPVVIEFPPSG